MKMLAVFLFFSTVLLAQTGDLRIYLFEPVKKSFLKNWKVSVFVDDSLCQGIINSDENGQVSIKKVKVGKHNVSLHIDGFRNVSFDMDSEESKSAYMTLEVIPQRRKKQ